MFYHLDGWLLYLMGAYFMLGGTQLARALGW